MLWENAGGGRCSIAQLAQPQPLFFFFKERPGSERMKKAQISVPLIGIKPVTPARQFLKNQFYTMITVPSFAK